MAVEPPNIFDEGTTDSTNNAKTLTDGSAVFIVRDKRMKSMIDFFYPVGTMYISKDPSKTKADFPFMQYGTWAEVPANLCLQTGAVSEAGTQRSAGLPNITGSTAWAVNGILGTYSSQTTPYHENNGALLVKTDGKAYGCIGSQGSDSKGSNVSVNIDASLSNPIYGSSDTVQPPAYMVRAWVRTA